MLLTQLAVVAVLSIFYYGMISDSFSYL